MEEKDIKNIWKNYSSKLSSNLKINLSSLKERNMNNTAHELKKLKRKRIAEALIFTILAALLINFTIRNINTPQFILSGTILGIFTLIGLTGSLLQIGLIAKVDYSGPITTFQIQLEKLKTYSLQTFRLIILSVPFYFAYIVIGFKVLLNWDIYAYSNSSWLLWNLILSIVFVPLSIWLYKSLSYDSKKNWVKRMILDNGGKQIHSAIQFINEIEAFRKNNAI